MRAVGETRARLETTAVQAPAAAWHLHQSRRSRRHGNRPAAGRVARARARAHIRTRTSTPPTQSRRGYAQSHGQRNYIAKETSKTQHTPQSRYVVLVSSATFSYLRWQQDFYLKEKKLGCCVM